VDTLSADPEDVITDGAGRLRHYRGNCEAHALVRVGRTVKPQDVLREAEQDRRFYENSHGGVTLSGGEITVQLEFALETLALLKANGIPTAIETNLTAGWDAFEKLLPVLDLVMFDIKTMDAARHRIWTGAGNKRILNNARRMSERDVPLIVRTPVIPGFNDDAESVEGVAEFLRDFANLSYYELLAFNPLGADKYHCLGLPYRMQEAQTIPVERMQELREAAAGHGLEVRIA